MKRRRFAFWIGLGLFTLAERLNSSKLDRLAAAVTDSAAAVPADKPAKNPTHWRAAENATWRWYEREELIEGQWMRTGITTPIHKESGARYADQRGYLDPNLVPANLRQWDVVDGDEPDVDDDDETTPHQPDPSRRARHGRPPSKWLRSLYADELHAWLMTIDVPEAGVSGMTYFTHLTRDHYFDADKIEGLSIADQAKLHAAAHHGY